MRHALLLSVLLCVGCARIAGTLHDVTLPVRAAITETGSLVNDVILLPTHLGQTQDLKVQVGGSLLNLPMSSATEEYTVKLNVTTVEFGAIVQFSGEWKRVLRNNSIILPMSPRAPALDVEQEFGEPLQDDIGNTH